ncbi:MAG: hypothetical protein ACYDBZ_15495 [Steroidobacteraceae bacterium]
MRKPGIPVLVHAAVSGLYWIAMNTALGAPPSHARGPHSEAARADLHPYLDLRPSLNGVAAAEAAPASFPSALHQPSLFGQQQSELPVMGAERAPGRVPSRAEAFAQRVHREGLPLARLWENKSALLSLGFNKKGKPGLWLVQKIR